MLYIPKCPVCDSNLSYDEVDIGVGVQTGNYRCDCCGWSPERDNEDYWEEVTGKFDGEL